MCGRFLLDADVEELLDRYRKRKGVYNNSSFESEIFPTNRVPVITSSCDIVTMKWGLINPYLKRPVINARSETVHIKPMFKNAILHRRCIVPANAFFEWKKEGTSKIKYKVFIEDERIFSMAGLYGDFIDDKGDRIQAFAIITRPPNSFMSEIHDRMPVILSRDKEDIWLDTDIKDINLIRSMFTTSGEQEPSMRAEKAV